jgi:hypothetical protein
MRLVRIQEILVAKGAGPHFIGELIKQNTRKSEKRRRLTKFQKLRKSQLGGLLHNLYNPMTLK